MKRINLEGHKQRISLLLLCSGVALIFLLVTSILVGVVAFFLIKSGAMKLGDVELSAWTLLFHMILVSIGIGEEEAVEEKLAAVSR